MLFKNIQLFQITEPFKYSAEALNEKFADFRIKPCGKTQLFTQGWESPFGKNNDVLVHSTNGRYLFTACKHEKILPATVINDTLNEKIDAIEATEQRKVSKKEKQSLRDEVTITLLTQAFTKKTKIHAYIDPEAQLLVVDTSNRNKAEELVTLIRESLGSFKATPIECKSSPSAIMTDWLINNNCPITFNIEQSCEMLDPRRENGLIKCQQQDLGADEIRAHLTTGKYVTKLALSWQDKLSLVMHDDMSIKQIRYLDLLQEQRDSYETETEAEKIDTDFTLMSGEYAQLFDDIAAAFDGFNKS